MYFLPSVPVDVSSTGTVVLRKYTEQFLYRCKSEAPIQPSSPSIQESNERERIYKATKQVCMVERDGTCTMIPQCLSPCEGAMMMKGRKERHFGLLHRAALASSTLVSIRILCSSNRSPDRRNLHRINSQECPRKTLEH